MNNAVTVRCSFPKCPRTRKVPFDNTMPDGTVTIVSLCPWHEADSDYEEYFDKDNKPLGYPS